MARKETDIKKDKKAWIKILESAIAVMLMIGFFSILTMKHVALPDVSEEVYELKRAVLEDVSQDDFIRQAVLDGDAETVYEFIRRRLSPSLSFAVRICDPAEKCEFPVADAMEEQLIPVNTYYPNGENEVDGLGEPTSNVYSDDYLISSSLKDIDPNIIRLFVWFEVSEITPEDLEPYVPICANSIPDEGEECEHLFPGYEFYDINEVVGTLLLPQPTCWNPYPFVLGDLSCDVNSCAVDTANCDACEGGLITFADNYPQESGGKVEFISSTSLTSGTYQLIIYDINRNILQQGTNYDLQLYPSGTLTVDNLLDWPPIGSVIVIRYDDACQDFF